jgi:hypothetical protein
MLSSEILPARKKNCLLLMSVLIVYDIFGLALYNPGVDRVH